MPRKKMHRRKPFTPEDEDKYNMVENLVFILLMVISVGAVMFVAVKYLLKYLGSIHINIPP